jgi:hypothetical protein
MAFLRLRSVVVQFDFNAASQPNHLGLIRPLAEM